MVLFKTLKYYSRSAVKCHILFGYVTTICINYIKMALFLLYSFQTYHLIHVKETFSYLSIPVIIWRVKHGRILIQSTFFSSWKHQWASRECREIVKVLTVPLIYCKDPFLVNNTCERMNFNGLIGSRCSNCVSQMVTMKAGFLEIGECI